MDQCFFSFHFWFLVTFGNKVTKILRNLCLHFARKKKWKENHATKVTKIPKTKRQKYGMNKTKINKNEMTVGSKQKLAIYIETNWG